MAKHNGNNGKGELEADPVVAAFETADSILSETAIGAPAMRMLQAFVAKWPKGDRAALADRVLWAVRELEVLWMNDVRSRFLCPIMAELDGLKILEPGESATPLHPDAAVTANMARLVAAGWGSVPKCDDLGYLRGDGCPAVRHHDCLHLRQHERIEAATPSAVTAIAPDGSSRTIDRVALAEAFRPMWYLPRKWDESVIDSLRRSIAATERHIEEQNRPPSRGIIIDEWPVK